jgi:hypothetical protein
MAQAVKSLNTDFTMLLRKKLLLPMKLPLHRKILGKKVDEM